MFVRILSALTAAAVVAVSLLPSTMALYAAVNGTAWDLQDLDTFPSQLLSPAVSAFALGVSPVRLAPALRTDVTRPLAYVPLFELECALLR